MHIFFSGIGGSGIGPLALIAKQAGYEVSGSDAKHSSYIDYLEAKGISRIHIGQTTEQIAQEHSAHPIDWFVYSSALPKTDPDHPELVFCQQNNIRATRRDDLLNEILSQKKLKLIAVAGTHGKTSTTAMAVWVFKKLGLPVSYSVGAKLEFGEMGQYQAGSEYFVYEADEYDRNFLSFYPQTALISGISYDHPDIYPTRESYYEAFQEFLDQSDKAVIWHDDAERLGLDAEPKYKILDRGEPAIESIKLAGLVNRQNAWLVAEGLASELGRDTHEIVDILNEFPGLARRFEQIMPNIYSDYAHTPEKIRGALQMAHESTGGNVVVVYEGLHNTRQHFIKDQLANLFEGVKKLYILPSYLAREDKDLELLTPVRLLNLLSNSVKERAEAAELDASLATKIKGHQSQGDLVLCLTAGGAGSLDEWLRKEFKQ